MNGHQQPYNGQAQGQAYGAPDQQEAAPYHLESQDVLPTTTKSARRHTYCCCFHTRRTCCLAILIPLFAILFTIAFLIFWFWPYMPEYGRSDPYVPTQSGNVAAFAPYLPGNSEWQPGLRPAVPQTLDPSATLGFAYGLGMDVWVNNRRNRFDIAADRVDVVGKIKGEDGQYVDTNKFNLTVNMVNVNFPKNANTTVPIPLTLRYSTPLSTLISATRDPVLQLLSSSCNQKILSYTPSGASPPLTLDFNVNIAPRILRAFNVPIKINVGPVNLPCPPEMKAFLADLDAKFGALGQVGAGVLEAVRGAG
ncbi:hypothetical protein DFJ77DRAFT_468492 [Powellomyces hirtus]|nr:hypothetical protein DFJ77DRAFT_468492 [Powellomyces hirtus]